MNPALALTYNLDQSAIALAMIGDFFLYLAIGGVVAWLLIALVRRIAP